MNSPTVTGRTLRVSHFLIAGIALGVIAVFTADIITRRGITAWLPYFLLLLATVWAPDRRVLVSLTGTMVSLIIAAHFLKPGGDVYASMINRGFGIAILVSMAFFLDMYWKARQETNRACEEAKTANQAKSNFISMVSHELRSPLTGVLGFSEFILTEPLGPIGEPKYLEYIKDIHDSGTHLLDLINNILDIAKMEVGRMDVAPDWLEARPLIVTVVRLLREQSSRRGHSISVDLPENKNIIFWADRRAVSQSLINLLSNAIKFTPNGGRIIVSARDTSDGGVEIAVADTGVGIPASHIDRVFRPFERLDNAYHRSKDAGTGLGLPLVKGLIELHGGRISIDSKEKVGTMITLYFPPPTRHHLLECPSGCGNRKS